MQVSHGIKSLKFFFKSWKLTNSSFTAIEWIKWLRRHRQMVFTLAEARGGDKKLWKNFLVCAESWGGEHDVKLASEQKFFSQLSSSLSFTSARVYDKVSCSVVTKFDENGKLYNPSFAWLDRWLEDEERRTRMEESEREMEIEKLHPKDDETCTFKFSDVNRNIVSMPSPECESRLRNKILDLFILSFFSLRFHPSPSTSSSSCSSPSLIRMREYSWILIKTSLASCYPPTPWLYKPSAWNLIFQ